MVNDAPAISHPYNLTVSTDHTIYPPGAQVNINGTLADKITGSPAIGILVGIKVTDPQNNLVYQTIVVTDSAGLYNTSFIHMLGNTQQVGIYTILANAASNGTLIASTNTTYSVK